MKRLKPFILFITLFSFFTHADESAAKPKVQQPKQVLFVGNSYFYYNDSLHNHIKRMAEAADADNAKSYKFKSATISGAYLRQHNIDSYLAPGQLGYDKPFDYVILQGHSTAALSYEKHQDFLATVSEDIKKIRDSGAEPALYMTTAYVPPHKKTSIDMLGKIQKLYDEAGQQNNALVIPVGLAFAKSYKQNPNLNLHQLYDGSHPNMLGTYLAAATTYATLYGVSPVGNPYTYFGAVDEQTANYLQVIAKETVEEYFGVKL